MHLQDLNNYDLNKDALGGYRAPGGPISSYPLYRIHGGDHSPKPSTPTSPSTLRSPSSPNHPSFGFVPISPIGGPVSPSAGQYGVHLNPERLINKSPSDLPDGVDPTRKEVGAESRVELIVQKNGTHSVKTAQPRLRADGEVSVLSGCKVTVPRFIHELLKA